MKNRLKVKKTFTLVELMIVIAVLAILASIVLFALNPMKVLNKARDSVRVTDINSLYKAITFMETWSPDFDYGSATTVYISLPDSSSTCGSYTLPALVSGYDYECSSLDDYKKTNGDGWIPIDFSVDFDDRGMDNNQSDGTDWGEDDGSKKCGTTAGSTGAWFIWVK